MTNTIYVRPVYIDEDSIEGSETTSPARDQNGVDQTTNRLETRVDFLSISSMNCFAAASRSLNEVGKNWRTTAAGSRINKIEGTTHSKAFDFGTNQPCVAIKLESIPDMVQGVWSDNFELQLEFTTKFRKLLSSENFDRIEEVIKACVVPRFVEFLERQDLPQLQYEAAWALTNFDDVSKQPLGNVVGGSPSFNEHSKLSMLRNASRTLCEYCHARRQPFEQDKLVLLALRHLIHSTDDRVLKFACWGLFHLSDCCYTSYEIQAVIDAGVFPRFVDLLLHPSDKVVEPALGTINNIAMGDDAQKQYILDNSRMLPCLYQLLTQNRDENIRITACWTIALITRGNRGQIQIFDQPRMHQIQTALCMVCLENILRAGEADKKLGKNNGVNIYAQMIDECKGLDKVRNLQSHYNKEIKKKDVKILERYWVEDEDHNVNN